MRRLRSTLFLGASLGLALSVASCFIEPTEPSTFRFQCSADGECQSDEVCSNGLCQQPCGGQDDAECDIDEPVCLNGYCSSVCPVDDDVCPAPQSCISLSAEEEPGASGVCTVLCEGDADCGDAEVCVSGFCVATCASVDDCSAGQECLAGFCV